MTRKEGPPKGERGHSGLIFMEVNNAPQGASLARASSVTSTSTGRAREDLVASALQAVAALEEVEEDVAMPSALKADHAVIAEVEGGAGLLTSAPRSMDSIPDIPALQRAALPDASAGDIAAVDKIHAALGAADAADGPAKAAGSPPRELRPVPTSLRLKRQAEMHPSDFGARREVIEHKRAYLDNAAEEDADRTACGGVRAGRQSLVARQLLYLVLLVPYAVAFLLHDEEPLRTDWAVWLGRPLYALVIARVCSAASYSVLWLDAVVFVVPPRALLVLAAYQGWASTCAIWQALMLALMVDRRHPDEAAWTLLRGVPFFLGINFWLFVAAVTRGMVTALLAGVFDKLQDDSYAVRAREALFDLRVARAVLVRARATAASLAGARPRGSCPGPWHRWPGRY